MSIPTPTTRLVFRDWQTTDLDVLYAICSDPRVMQYVRDGQPWSVAWTSNFIDRQIHSATTLGYCQWALVSKADARVIGYCGFIPAEDGGELGWRLAHRVWGRGLATEAARAALAFGFFSLRFNRVVATVQSANQASLRVAEKLGMKPTRTLHRNGRELIEFGCQRPTLEVLPRK